MGLHFLLLLWAAFVATGEFVLADKSAEPKQLSTEGQDSDTHRRSLRVLSKDDEERGPVDLLKSEAFKSVTKSTGEAHARARELAMENKKVQLLLIKRISADARAEAKTFARAEAEAKAIKNYKVAKKQAGHALEKLPEESREKVKSYFRDQPDHHRKTPAQLFQEYNLEKLPRTDVKWQEYNVFRMMDKAYYPDLYRHELKSRLTQSLRSESIRSKLFKYKVDYHKAQMNKAKSEKVAVDP